MDFVIVSLSMTPSRNRGIEFLLPFSTHTSAFYIKTPTGQELRWDLYVLPFTFRLWAALALFGVVYSVIGQVAINILEKKLADNNKKLFTSICFHIIQTMAFIKTAYFGICLEMFGNKEMLLSIQMGNDFTTFLFCLVVM